MKNYLSKLVNLRRGCQSPLNTPLVPNDTTSDCRLSQPSNFTPFTNMFFFTSEFIINVMSSVSRLHKHSSPAAILRSVVTVCIDPIKSSIFFSIFLNMNKITWMHIFSKVLEILPPFADFYASTAIIFKRFVLWIKNATSHMFPYDMKSSSRHPMNVSRTFCACVKSFLAFIPRPVFLKPLLYVVVAFPFLNHEQNFYV